MSHPRSGAALICALLTLLVAPAAHAAATLKVTDRFANSTLVEITGDDNSQTFDIAVTAAGGGNELTVTLPAGSWTTNVPGTCSQPTGTQVRCPVGAIAVDARLVGGADTATLTSSAANQIAEATFDMADGDDTLTLRGPMRHIPDVDLGNGSDQFDAAQLVPQPECSSCSAQMRGVSVLAGNGVKHLTGTPDPDAHDAVNFDDRTAGVTVDLQDGTIAGGGTISAFEDVYGTSHDDTLRGNGRANVLSGQSGTDILDGRDGNDTFDTDDEHQYFKAFSDSAPFDGTTIYEPAGADTVTCGAGTDTLTADSADTAVTECESRRAGLSGYLTVDKTAVRVGDTVTATAPTFLPAVGGPGTETFGIYWTACRLAGGRQVCDSAGFQDGPVGHYTVKDGDEAVIATASITGPTGGAWRETLIKVGDSAAPGPAVSAPAPESATSTPSTPASNPPSPAPSSAAKAAGTPSSAKPTNKPMTRAQKLAAALKRCAKAKSKSKRAACRHTARRLYGPKKTKK